MEGPCVVTKDTSEIGKSRKVLIQVISDMGQFNNSFIAYNHFN